MKKASEVTALVLDNGSFHHIAIRLAQVYKKVYYAPNWRSSFPAIEEAWVGREFVDGEPIDTFDGLPLETIEHPFEVIDECDILVTPDVYMGDLAAYFHDKGKPVFGSMRAEDLEIERFTAHQLFKEYGIDVSNAKEIIGIDKLRDYLKKQKSKKWIKISKFRKLFETFGADDMRLTELELDRLAYSLGPMKNLVPFIVEDDVGRSVQVHSSTLKPVYQRY